MKVVANATATLECYALLPFQLNMLLGLPLGFAQFRQLNLQ